MNAEGDFDLQASPRLLTFLSDAFLLFLNLLPKKSIKTK
jgi:hypothetical protein